MFVKRETVNYSRDVKRRYLFQQQPHFLLNHVALWWCALICKLNENEEGYSRTLSGLIGNKQISQYLMDISSPPCYLIPWEINCLFWIWKTFKWQWCCDNKLAKMMKLFFMIRYTLSEFERLGKCLSANLS